MSIWDRLFRERPVYWESFSTAPSGGRITRWFCGVFLALIPIRYGVRCIFIERATLWGKFHSHLTVRGTAAISLGIAYIAIGAFAHFHWFWGLHPRLQPFTDVGKLITLLVFLSSLGYAFCQILSS